MAPQYIDKTGLFRDILKEAQNREDIKPDKNRILNKRKEKDPLEVKAHLIIEHTTQLQCFLAENRESYIDVLNKTYSSNAMSDFERDKIDADTNSLIKTINSLVDDFKKDLRKRLTKLSGQHTLHLEAVSDILEADLKLACQNFSEQRAIRVQKELEIQKLSRLEIKARKSTPLKHKVEPEDTQEKPEQQQINWALEDDEDSDSNQALSPEEVQLFERENEKMLEDLMSLKDDVQQIESKVVKIAELQQIFTEKVLQQKDDIELISSNAVGASENIKDGNEEIRKAIQNRASIRVYILFFLLVMAFTLLFLDWYNE
jgi:syntaxin 18